MSPAARYAATTVALGLVGMAHVLGQGWLDRPAPPRPSRPAAGRPAPPAPPLTARDLLDRTDGLALTAAQRARLAALDERSREEVRDLELAVAAARGRFTRVPGGER